ncbi:MAG TPA: helix-turn-helix domain-containing protein, partial [Candidatus Methylacidiphilales bacterium]|nr:helix-turn-helix domain-containing protein [Candidatus Methylacidiphilales bacterium]
RVGGSQMIPVHARIIAATNKDLKVLVNEGTFRDDLYFRLKVVPITMPPLRERKEDIPLLMNAFLKEYSKENNKKIVGFSPEAQDAIMRNNWPGNVRELRASIEGAVALARTERIGLKDLPLSVQFYQREPVVPGFGDGGAKSFALGDRSGGGGANGEAGFASAHASSDASLAAGSQNLNLEQMEKAFIVEALRRSSGNRTEAARLLGISRRTLHRKIHELQLEDS